MICKSYKNRKIYLNNVLFVVSNFNENNTTSGFINTSVNNNIQLLESKISKLEKNDLCDNDIKKILELK